MVTPAARRFLKGLIDPILTAAGWTWTPPGQSTPVPRVFHGVAQTGAPYPLVVIQMLSPGNDLHTQDGSDIYSTPLYLVKAVAQGSGTDAIEPIAGAIDDALHNARGNVSGGHVIECWRERPHELPEVTDGRFYSNLGAEYRLAVQGV